MMVPKRAFITCASRRSAAIFITFDDGPHPEHTPRVLDALAAFGAKATFFVVGAEAERYPEIVRRMVIEGHSVGDHSWAHADIRRLSKARFLDDLRRSNDLLSGLTGQRTRLFRPPNGKLGLSQFITLLFHGYTIALWNVDSRDYACESLDSVKIKLHDWSMQAGDIVLLHDRMKHAHDSTSWILERAKAARPELQFKAL